MTWTSVGIGYHVKLGDMFDWLHEQCGGDDVTAKWYQASGDSQYLGVVYFKDPNQAMMFKLIFG